MTVEEKTLFSLKYEAVNRSIKEVKASIRVLEAHGHHNVIRECLVPMLNKYILERDELWEKKCG